MNKKKRSNLSTFDWKGFIVFIIFVSFLTLIIFGALSYYHKIIKRFDCHYIVYDFKENKKEPYLNKATKFCESFYHQGYDKYYMVIKKEEIKDKEEQEIQNKIKEIDNLK